VVVLVMLVLVALCYGLTSTNVDHVWHEREFTYLQFQDT